MRETSESISQWAEATFGPAVSLASIAARALTEMAELVRKVTGPEPDPKALAEECADVVIVLARLAHRCGCEIFSGETTPYPHWIPPTLIGEALLTLAKMSEVLMRKCPENQFDRNLSQHRCIAIRWLLQSACTQLGHDLRAEVDAKMAINRAREWKLDGHGHGQHVKLNEGSGGAVVNQVVAILEGCDWSDASVEHLEVPEGLDLPKARQEYIESGRSRGSTYLSFANWLIEFRGCTETDIVEIYDE